MGNEIVFNTGLGRLAMRKLVNVELRDLLKDVNMGGISYRSDGTFGSKYFQGIISFHDDYYCLNIPSNKEECFEIYVDHKKSYFAVGKGDSPGLNSNNTVIESFNKL